MVFPNLSNIIAEEVQGNYEFEHRDVNGYNTLYLKKDGVVIMYDMVNRPIKDIYESNLNNAIGDVLICGLGCGFSIFPIKDLPEVNSITVIENDATIISLMAPYLDGVTIIEADANSYVPDMMYDFIFLDIWGNSNNLIEKYSHTLRYQLFLKVDGIINYLDLEKYYTIKPSLPVYWQPPSISLGDLELNGVTMYLSDGAGYHCTFDANSSDEIVLNIHLDKNGTLYDGSELEICMNNQLFNSDPTGKNVIIVIDYAFVMPEGVDNANTKLSGSVEKEFDVNGRTANRLYCDHISGIEGEAGATQLQLTIKRKSSGAGSDTYPDDWDLYTLEIKKHY